MENLEKLKNCDFRFKPTYYYQYTIGSRSSQYLHETKEITSRGRGSFGRITVSVSLTFYRLRLMNRRSPNEAQCANSVRKIESYKVLCLASRWKISKKHFAQSLFRYVHLTLEGQRAKIGAVSVIR